jgi:hypothetical protein
MGCLFTICSINPEPYMAGPREEAVQAIERHNVSSIGWFPRREQLRMQS